MAKRALYGRLLSRAQAVQILFQAQTTMRPVDAVLAGDYVVTDGPIDAFGQELALGVAAHTAVLDRIIDAVIQNWTLERMPLVDKIILRLALYELLIAFDLEVSDRVAISEAVNLAKVFGGEDSYIFINGVLGRVSREMDAGRDFLDEAQKAEAEASIARSFDVQLTSDAEADALAFDAVLPDAEPLEAIDPASAQAAEVSQLKEA